jgi:hypothetical protein
VIVGDKSVVAVVYATGFLAEGVPDRLSLAIFMGSAFDLVARGRNAPEEVFWKHASPISVFFKSRVCRNPNLCLIDSLLVQATPRIED